MVDDQGGYLLDISCGKHRADTNWKTEYLTWMSSWTGCGRSGGQRRQWHNTTP
ncbi:hypothetical protein PAJ34TS1_00220 [Paenibacillus azoreducens]